MPGMKVTLDAAMRARDVSRPHAEHDDRAVAGEPQPARTRDPGQDTRDARDTRGAPPAGPAPADTARGAAAGGAQKGRSPRRRRRRR
jgi:hypothetical protein